VSAVRSESPGLGIAFDIGGCNLIRFSDTDPAVEVVDLAVVPEVFEAAVDLLGGKLVRFFIVFSLSLVMCNEYLLGAILRNALRLVVLAGFDSPLKGRQRTPKIRRVTAVRTTRLYWLRIKSPSDDHSGGSGRCTSVQHTLQAIQSAPDRSQ
jgi:hypothetical protein